MANNPEAEFEILPADADDTTMDVHDVDLAVGENVVTVTVTAEDGSTQAYTITVTRAALEKTSDSTLSESHWCSPGSPMWTSSLLVPPFATGTTSYEAGVKQYVTSTTVTAMATGANTGATRDDYAG